MEELQQKLLEYRKRRNFVAQSSMNKDGVAAPSATTRGNQDENHGPVDASSLDVTQQQLEAESSSVRSHSMSTLDSCPAWLLQLAAWLARHSYIFLLLKLCIYSLLQTIFIKIDFGGPFFVLALLYFVWSSMKSGSRKEDEPSAYSVFNPNCERLLGQLTAEQFEGEIRRGGI